MHSLSLLFLLPKGSRRRMMIKERRAKMKWNQDNIPNIQSTHCIPLLKGFHVYPQPQNSPYPQREIQESHTYPFSVSSPIRRSSSHTSLPELLQTHSALPHPIPPLYSGFLQAMVGLSSICLLASLQKGSLILIVYECLLN